jgi:hypothetical protein
LAADFAGKLLVQEQQLLKYGELVAQHLRSHVAALAFLVIQELMLEKLSALFRDHIFVVYQALLVALMASASVDVQIQLVFAGV